jgi:integrase
MHWLESRNIQRFENITNEILKEYIMDIIDRFASTTARHMVSNVRQLYRYLVEKGFISQDFRLILMPKIVIEHKILPALGRDEVSAVLNSIDRSTNIGRRNYAIVLMAAMTGLRAIDITKLKLTNIDWQRGEIHITQAKTSKPLTLPLTKEVGTALQDYILNARPKCDSECVFVRVNAPYIGLSHSSAVCSVYTICFNEVGLRRKAWDGRSFHSLRRSLALSMVVSGIPITTVAEVLGHSNLKTVRQYVSLNSKQLKVCVLGFDSIKPTVVSV